MSALSDHAQEACVNVGIENFSSMKVKFKFIGFSNSVLPRAKTHTLYNVYC
jgi:hypothetical protein